MSNNQNLVQNLYTAMEKPIFLGDRLRSGQFGTLMQPGQYIDTELTQGDSTDDMHIQASLVDDCLSASFLYQPTGSKISDTYNEILEFAALPSMSASPELQREIQLIRRWKQEHEQKYELYRDRYNDALDAFDAERLSTAPSGSRMRRLAQRRDDALDAWVHRGYKRDWENKQGRLVQILAGSPEAYWNELRRKLDANKRIAPTRGNYLQTLLDPAVSRWPRSSWSKFDCLVDDQTATRKSRSTSWGGGGGFGIGLWSFGAGVSGSTDRRTRETTASEIEIEFEYQRVRIVRPWLNSNIFNQRFWTWKRTHGFDLLSDGGNLHAEPPVRPAGRMPLLPTHAIIARNVSLRAEFSESEHRYMHSQFTSRMSVGWGPFKVSGYYSKSTMDQYDHAHVEKEGITIERPQIIAFTGNLHPATPNPDRSLPWGPDAVFENESPNETDKLIESERAQDELRYMSASLDLDGVAR